MTRPELGLEFTPSGIYEIATPKIRDRLSLQLFAHSGKQYSPTKYVITGRYSTFTSIRDNQFPGTNISSRFQQAKNVYACRQILAAEVNGLPGKSL